MAERTAPVSAMQRLWLKEMGVGRALLPEPPRPLARAVAADDQAAPAADLPKRAAGAEDVSPRSAVSDALAALAAGRPGQASAGRRPSAGAQPAVRPVPGAAALPPAQTGGAAAQIAAPPEAAAPVAVAVRGPLAQDMAGLREQVLACTACDLCQTRRQAVFGDGAFPARWMVIGEAPGEQEDRQGSPFVGRAGQLLDAMLAAVNLQRGREVFIANVIKCRPPANRNPRPEELAACSPYLMKQIELIQPEGILVLGRFAAHTLLQTEASIGNLRGRIHSWRDGQGREIPLVVSYHPAYLLRSPHAKAAAWQDLRLAAAQTQAV
ncbi:uracil-DNA glycosylase [Kerstersia sp.]|uniref:uracil-DNA glycosylase n=1 Tax=Kerstersia sp. TaxID=1930783 RepID=UPI003F8F30DA